MRLILSRHGNTFAQGDKVVWVGARTDLPLVPEGLRQAERLGRALREAGVTVSALVCGPLQRTRRYADIAAAHAGLALLPAVDPALLEIDYGAWEGLSSEEIAARFGRAELDVWERQSRWPETAGWMPGEAALAGRIADFAARLAWAHTGKTVLAITSNGVLRYFLRLVPGAFEERLRAGTLKVATGHVCVIDLGPERSEVCAWNVAPEPRFLQGS